MKFIPFLISIDPIMLPYLIMPFTTILGTVVGSFATNWYQRRNTSGTVKTSSASELWQKSTSFESNIMAMLNTANTRIEKLERDYANAMEAYYALRKEKEDADAKVVQLQREVIELREEIDTLRRDNEQYKTGIRPDSG